jgi:hypothetical protein
MTESVELKKLVKQLQSAATDEVNGVFSLVAFPLYCQAHSLRFFQETADILRILKREFQVNEAVLRVRSNYFFPILVKERALSDTLLSL